MTRGFVAEKLVVINVPPSRVWDALTNPSLIEKYLFGTKVTSDWKAGSSITYRGTWQGKSYEDKGSILKLEKEKLLESTFFSSMSGVEDKEENYAIVTYSLKDLDGRTLVTVTQDNNDDEAGREHSEKNWEMVLNQMKKVLESQ